MKISLNKRPILPESYRNGFLRSWKVYEEEVVVKKMKTSRQLLMSAEQ